MVDDLVQLESLVKQYVVAYNTTVDDRVLQCVFKKAAPPEVKSQIELTEYSSSSILSDALKSWHSARFGSRGGGGTEVAARQRRDQRGADDMDIGYVSDKRGKKGDDKKGGRGYKGQDGKQKFEDKCDFCQTPGRRWSDCWSRHPTKGKDTRRHRWHDLHG